MPGQGDGRAAALPHLLQPAAAVQLPVRAGGARARALRHAGQHVPPAAPLQGGRGPQIDLSNTPGATDSMLE